MRPFHMDSHLRDLIERVLFTALGERVNRPAFGCGEMQLVFTPNSGVLASVTQQL
jgi:phage baseplate assembly protein W